MPKSYRPIPHRSRWLLVFWPLLYCVSPMVVVALYFAGGWYTFFDKWSIAVTLGLFGYIYLLNQFFTASRPSYFARLYGLDRVIRFHAMMGTIGVICIVIHSRIRLGFIGSELNRQIRFGQSALQILVLLIVVAIFLLSRNPISTSRPVAALRRRIVRTLGIRYRHILLLHNLTAVAMTLALLHVLMASSTASAPLRTVVMSLWYAAAMTAYGVKKILLPLRRRRNPFRVISLQRHSSDILTVNLQVPAPVQFRYQAGQFAFFRIPTLGREEHPFTISSDPQQATDHAAIAFTAKMMGPWSDKLSHLVAGSAVQVEGPYGRFCCDQIPPTAAICYIAGGIGITPFVSMVGDLRRRQPKAPIRLIWSVRRREHLCHQQHLQELSQALDNFSMELVVTGEGRRKRIDASLIKQSLRPASPVNSQFFVCGPSNMITEITRHLRSLNAPRQAIHAERFGF